MLSIFRELWAFMRVRKKWWLGPILVTMLLLSALIVLTDHAPEEVRQIAQVDGVGRVNVKLVWDPMWTPELMSEDARLALGMI